MFTSAAFKNSSHSSRSCTVRQLLQILIKKVAKISELVFVAAVIAPIVDQKYLSYPVIIVSFVCCILTLVLSVLYGAKAADGRDSSKTPLKTKK